MCITSLKYSVEENELQISKSITIVQFYGSLSDVVNENTQV